MAGIRSAVQAEKAKVEKMKEDNAALTAQIAQIQSPEFIEGQIRNKLGLVKPGEAIVVLPDADTLRKLAPQMPVEVDTFLTQTGESGRNFSSNLVLRGIVVKSIIPADVSR